MTRKAQHLILLGISLNIIQWIVILIIFNRIMSHFDGYTIFNPNVTHGSTVSFSFVDWLMSMIYSGVPFNYLVFIAIVACLLYLIPTFIFIILEIIAYFMIKKRPNSAWSSFILAVGIKNVLTDISGVPFLTAGLMLHKENKKALES